MFIRLLPRLVASVCVGFCTAYLIDLAQARYQLWEAENRWENAKADAHEAILHDILLQRPTTH